MFYIFMWYFNACNICETYLRLNTIYNFYSSSMAPELNSMRETKNISHSTLRVISQSNSKHTTNILYLNIYTFSIFFSCMPLLNPTQDGWDHRHPLCPAWHRHGEGSPTDKEIAQYVWYFIIIFDINVRLYAFINLLK